MAIQDTTFFKCCHINKSELFHACKSSSPWKSCQKQTARARGTKDCIHTATERQKARSTLRPTPEETAATWIKCFGCDIFLLDTRLAFEETPLKYFAEQKGTYEYPDVQNVFPSLPQQFMHPSIHHDHAVKRMLYPKPKVLMMFRPPLQSFTCPPPLQCCRMIHLRMP